MIVEFVHAAEVELDEAFVYLETQRLGLGVEFAEDVAAAALKIMEHPNAWQRLRGGVRRYQLSRFEYGLVYLARGNVVTNYAAMHLKRRPGYWRQRLKSAT